VAGRWCWFVVREKYCWLTGGRWLVLIWCERKTKQWSDESSHSVEAYNRRNY
jgi:hypothetical protein